MVLCVHTYKDFGILSKKIKNYFLKWLGQTASKILVSQGEHKDLNPSQIQECPCNQQVGEGRKLETKF